MIGFYDYTVIMTYASLCISMIGMYYAFTGHTHVALMCLAISGFLDSFDGKVARTKKNRTEDEKSSASRSTPCAISAASAFFRWSSASTRACTRSGSC